MKKQRVNKVRIEILEDGLGCDAGDIITVKEPISSGATYYYDSCQKWFEPKAEEKNITWRILK